MNSIQEKEFRRRQISFVGLLSAITVILLGLHYYIYYYFAASVDLKIPLWTVYAFHFIVVLLIYSFINYRHTSGKTDVFNVFMILTSLENKVPDVLNFFFPYFIYLGLEVWTVTNFLKEKTN